MANGNMTSRVMCDTGAAQALAEVADVTSLHNYLETAGLTPANDDPTHLAGAIIKAEGVSTQGHFAAIIVNFTHGEGKMIDPEGLTEALRKAFPEANIGKRHGPHYLCHARKGSLKGLREGMSPIPFVKRAKKSIAKTKAAEAEVVESDEISVLEDRGEVTADALMAEYDRRTLQIRAKELGVNAGGKTEVIAQRVADAINSDTELVA
jgi:hypothetical protein